MKNTLFLAVAVTVISGCKPSDDRVPRAAEPTVTSSQPATAADSSANRKEAQDRMSATLQDIDAKLAELKARAQTAGDQAKAEWEARRPQLEAQRDAAARRLDELKTASKDTWDTTRTKTEAAFAELEKGFKEAWAKLKE